MRIAPIPKAREVLEHYQFICAVCFSPATQVHEIMPKSKRPADWWAWENRVPLCANCHDRVHQEGTAAWEERLRESRDVLAILLADVR